MNKKLYVGNINYDTTDERLRELFAQVGEVVSAVVITDRMTGRSKGFAFVKMASEEDARMAIERFIDYDLDARNIKVAEARPRRERPAWGGWDDRRGRF